MNLDLRCEMGAF